MTPSVTLCSGAAPLDEDEVMRRDVGLRMDAFTCVTSKSFAYIQVRKGYRSYKRRYFIVQKGKCVSVMKGITKLAKYLNFPFCILLFIASNL